MRISVTSKLFIAIFATSALVAVAMGAAARYSFTRGFLGYLNEQSEARLDDVLPVLQAAYREHGDWEFLRDNPRAWFRLIRPSRDAADAVGSVPTPRSEPLPPSDVELTGLNLRVAVLDTQGRVVIGPRQMAASSVRRRIVVDDVTVGWLAMLPFEEVTVAADVRFQEKQFRATWIVGGMAALMAAVVAYGLARLFLAPVRRMASAAARLAAGDYATRVDVASTDEIGALADDFNQLASALEKNERMRRALMADVSHELRTPLAVLRGELEALEDGVRPLTRDSIHSLQAEAALLSKLVDDLYDLSLSDAGALTYRKVVVDAVATLQAALDAHRERFVQSGLKLSFKCDVAEFLVLADESRLRQLFINLIENSLRYTDRGGELRVRAHVHGTQLQIDFEDSAPGVPDEQLPFLFDRFFRVEASRNRASGGAGLGLAICRNIVDAHGGQLSASASPLGGLHMAIQLPSAREIA
jgi:two-component system sensor histidine kinase BaeS